MSKWSGWLYSPGSNEECCAISAGMFATTFSSGWSRNGKPQSEPMILNKSPAMTISSRRDLLTDSPRVFRGNPQVPQDGWRQGEAHIRPEVVLSGRNRMPEASGRIARDSEMFNTEMSAARVLLPGANLAKANPISTNLPQLRPSPFKGEDRMGHYH